MKSSNHKLENYTVFKRFGVGIDVHKLFSLLNVYSSRKTDEMEYIYDKTVRFEMTPQGFSEMVNFLKKFSNITVAFESTGAYSLLVYKVLQKHIPKEKILCVNAYFAKALPGRKSDKLDAQNLAKYAFFGLLKGSYILDNTYQILRRLTRSRKRLVRMAANSKNRIIMILDRAGLRINQDIGLFVKYGLKLLLDSAEGISLKQHIETRPSKAYILRYEAHLRPFFSIELLEFEREELQSALMEYFFLVKQVMETERSLYNFIAQEGNETLLRQWSRISRTIFLFLLLFLLAPILQIYQRAA